MKKRTKALAAGIIVAAVVVFGPVVIEFVRQSVPWSSAAPAEPIASLPKDRVAGPFKVDKVVDGDTIWVQEGDRSVKIRLIGLDTPEVHDPRKPVQCFGVEASDHAKQELTGKSVYLEADPSQNGKDKYGRDLAYVWTASGQLFNLEMISEGFGFEYTYDVRYRYQQQFRAAEDDARKNGRGLWAATSCDGKTGRHSLTGQDFLVR